MYLSAGRYQALPSRSISFRALSRSQTNLKLHTGSNPVAAVYGLTHVMTGNQLEQQSTTDGFHKRSLRLCIFN
jgi:hypothetical protein